MTELTIVIVSYNVKDYLDQCLSSLQRSLKGIDSEVYVVDNHSMDGTVEFISNAYPWVKIIRSQTNLGFSKANNKAIRRSQSQYVLLLNPDTILGEQVLSQALDFMRQHPKAGAAGVRMLRTDGSDARESRRGVPTPLTAFYKLFGFCSRFPRNRHFGCYYMGWLPWDKAAQIEVISGAFFLLRREALNQVGLLDEDFFMYGEDIDLSYRLLRGGWENWYLPLKILHYKGESTQKSSFRYVHVFYEAMLIFFRKHYGHLSFLITVPIQLGIYMKAITALLLMQWHRARKALGFVSNNNSVEPFYFFHTSRENIDGCRQMIQAFGLNAELKVEEGNTPVFAMPSTLCNETPVFQVFDITHYRVESILQLMSQHADQGCELATYDSEKQRLITGQTIFNLHS